LIAEKQEAYRIFYQTPYNGLAGSIAEICNIFRDNTVVELLMALLHLVYAVFCILYF
jgi:hypothetical protein